MKSRTAPGYSLFWTGPRGGRRRPRFGLECSASWKHPTGASPRCTGLPGCGKQRSAGKDNRSGLSGKNGPQSLIDLPSLPGSFTQSPVGQPFQQRLPPPIRLNKPTAPALTASFQLPAAPTNNPSFGLGHGQNFG